MRGRGKGVRGEGKGNFWWGGGAREKVGQRKSQRSLKINGGGKGTQDVRRVVFVTNWGDSAKPHTCIHSAGMATHIDDMSCHTRHVTHVDGSCHTCGWVMSHTWMGHVTHVDGSCHTRGWVMSHMRKSYVSRTNESRTEACHKCVLDHTYE